MKKDPSEIARQIVSLVYELAEIAGSPTTPKLQKKETKGTVGALNILIGEDFLNSPQSLIAVINKLQEMGRHYPKSTVAMGLLNLTRSRVLVRIKNSKTKNWEYVVRK
ncbi:MAG: hypothetical protein NUV69_02305 [Candidatus Curtissbacteria bacterium]|nr:hypothetical protein [Candidatus Curtissbacteria bacterium]